MRRLGMRYRRQKSEWIEVRLQISPVAERVKNALTLAVRNFEHSGSSSWASRFGSGRHMSVTRITDATGCVLDSSLREQQGWVWPG